MPMQRAYDQLRDEVARWEFPYLEFHVPPPRGGPLPELGQMMLVVEAHRGETIVQQYGITVLTVLKAEVLALVVQDILASMVRSWGEAWLKRKEATPPVREGGGQRALDDVAKAQAYVESMESAGW